MPGVRAIAATSIRPPLGPAPLPFIPGVDVDLAKPWLATPRAGADTPVVVVVAYLAPFAASETHATLVPLVVGFWVSGVRGTV